MRMGKGRNAGGHGSDVGGPGLCCGSGGAVMHANLHFALSTFGPTAKALRMAFFSLVSVWVWNTPKPFLGFMSGLYRFYK